MAICHGNTEKHCCNLGSGGVCPYLEENTVPGRRWACGLMREYGNWDDVLASDAYKWDVAVWLEPKGIDCKSWPKPGQSLCYCGGKK
jgi:hypothetical protein